MLLYLGSNADNDVLDFLTKRKMIVKKLLGEFSLKKFVIHEMKNLDHYSYVVVDLDALNDSEDEIIEAIIAFNMLYNPRLIILAKEISNLFLYRIINEANIYDIVINKEDEDFIETFRMCLEESEQYRSNVRSYVKKINLKYSFPNEDVKILVGGIGSNFNTTKTAINIATFLSEIGAKVSFTEYNIGYLQKISKYYGFEDNSYKDIEFFFNGDVPVSFNFNVIDIGLLKEKNLKIFSDKDFADIRIVCCSAKQAEINKLIEFLDSYNFEVNIFLNYNTEKEKRLVRKILSNREKIYFTDNSSGLFDAKNASIYKEIIGPFIVEND